jgi:hypothetical protein
MRARARRLPDLAAALRIPPLRLAVEALRDIGFTNAL